VCSAWWGHSGVLTLLYAPPGSRSGLNSGACDDPVHQGLGALSLKQEAEKKKSASTSSTNTINLSSEFNCPASEVPYHQAKSRPPLACKQSQILNLQSPLQLFECFTVPQKVMAFTQSRAQVSS